tara:strand:- start:204 stop:635 length:432 start_codon:yes stop_codon:yes gene_type:complete
MEKIEDIKNIYKSYFKKSRNDCQVVKLLQMTLLNDYYIYYFKNNKFQKSFFEVSFLNFNNIIIWFPNDNISLVIHKKFSERINIVSSYYDNNYSEEPIKFKYYDNVLKIKINGPDILISTLPIESVFFDNKLLSESMIEYTIS